MSLHLDRPSLRPLWAPLALWGLLVVLSWLVPLLAGLDAARGWLVFLAAQALALTVAVAAALAAWRHRIDLSRPLFVASLLPLAWGLGLAAWLAALLVLAS